MNTMKTGNGKRKNKAVLLVVFFTVLLFASYWTRCDRHKFNEHALAGRTMGTSFSIKIVTAPDDVIDIEKVKNDIDSLLEQVNMQMSTYIDSSELSRFNKFSETTEFPVSKALSFVFYNAIQTSEKSDGAFDVTVGPLVNLWGFGPEHHKDEVPPDDEITERLSRVGYHNLSVDTSRSVVSKTIPELYCDLSSIAKGYGVDIVANYLEQQDYENYLVEIGGEIRARGHNANTDKWRIGIASPKTEPGYVKALSVNNVGVATSGDYLNYFEKNGIRYSHTIDPRTGRPITHNLASVTVIHPSCQIADAYATAISVLGPEKGYQFAIDEELLVFMIIREKKDFVEKMTPGFENLINTINNR